MSGNNVIPFPGTRRESPPQEVVRSPVALFSINDMGQVDLAEGVTVTDGVVAFWEAVSETVAAAWAEHPLGRERARVAALEKYLDAVRPGWREEVQWSD